jgi:hypothetical protein
MIKLFYSLLLLSSISYLLHAQSKDDYSEGAMFSKVGTENGQQFKDYTFKFRDTLFQVRKIGQNIDQLKINSLLIAKDKHSNYLDTISELIAMQDKDSPVEQPYPNPQPSVNPKVLELEPVEKNGKIPYELGKIGFYASGDIRVYYAKGYTIVKRKEEITKVYFKGNKISKEKWGSHEKGIESCIEEAEKRD